MLHRIAHWLHWQRVDVVSALDERGTMWIAFRCIKCGAITGIHAAYDQCPPLSRFEP